MAALPLTSRQFTFASNATIARSSPGALGEPFSFELNPPLRFDENRAWGIRCLSATIWYSNPTLVNGTSSRFGYSYSGTDYTIDLPSGNYGLLDLELAITTGMVANGHGSFSAPVFSFGANVSSGITFYQINAPYLGYAFAPDISTILIWGFPTDHAREAENASTPIRYEAPLVSDYAQGVESFVIHCDAVAGAYLNGQESNALFAVGLGVVPANSQITYETSALAPLLPLATRTISRIGFWITDGAGNRISLQGEPITLTIAIESA